MVAEEVRRYIKRVIHYFDHTEQSFVANKLRKQGDASQMMSYSTRLCFATGIVLISAYLVNNIKYFFWKRVAYLILLHRLGLEFALL